MAAMPSAATQATTSNAAAADIPSAPTGAPAPPMSTAPAAAPALPSLPLAVEAHFPDPPARYNTPGLQEGRLSWSTPAEISAWLHDLTAQAATPAPPTPKRSDRSDTSNSINSANRRRSAAVSADLLSLSLPSATSSTPGPTLQALHVSTPRKRTPETALKTPPAGAHTTGETAARPTVLLVGGRGGSAATEALLIVARELVRGKLRPLLARIDVVVVPSTELAGQPDASVPEDHVQLNTAGAQILAMLAQTQQATVLLSADEAPAMTTLGTQTMLRATDVTVAHASNPNLPEFLTRAAEQWFQQPLLVALQAEALRADKAFLSESSASPGETTRSGNIVNAAALQNRISLQVLSAGSDLGRAHVQRRVHAQVIAISSALTSTAKRTAELAELRPYLDREVTAQACRQPFFLEAATQPGAQAMQATQARTLLDLKTGAEILLPPRTEAAMPEQVSSSQTPQTRIKPCGYWLAADAGLAVARLRLHGVQVMRVAEPASLLGDTYQSMQATPLAPASAATNFTLVRGVIDAPADSFYVPVDQAQGNLVVSALEPDAASSLPALGLLDSATGLARIMTPPAVRLEPLP